jgi:hypothetical protein
MELSLLEKRLILLLLKDFPTFYGTQSFITMSQEPSNSPIKWWCIYIHRYHDTTLRDCILSHGIMEINILSQVRVRCKYASLYILNCWNVLLHNSQDWYHDGLWAGQLGFNSQQGKKIFLFSTALILALGPRQPPIQWIPGVLPWG